MVKNKALSVSRSTVTWTNVKCNKYEIARSHLSPSWPHGQPEKAEQKDLSQGGNQGPEKEMLIWNECCLHSYKFSFNGTSTRDISDQSKDKRRRTTHLDFNTKKKMNMNILDTTSKVEVDGKETVRI